MLLAFVIVIDFCVSVYQTFYNFSKTFLPQKNQGEPSHIMNIIYYFNDVFLCFMLYLFMFLIIL